MRNCIAILASLAYTVYGHPYSEHGVRPFRIDLSSKVPRMLQLVSDTKLPLPGPYLTTDGSSGVNLDTLIDLRSQWLSDFDWHREQNALNE